QASLTAEHSLRLLFRHDPGTTTPPHRVSRARDAIGLELPANSTFRSLRPVGRFGSSRNAERRRVHEPSGHLSIVPQSKRPLGGGLLVERGAFVPRPGESVRREGRAASHLEGSCRCLSPRGGSGSRTPTDLSGGTEQTCDVRLVATLQEDAGSRLEAVGDRARVLDLTRELEAFPKMRG